MSLEFVVYTLAGFTVGWFVGWFVGRWRTRDVYPLPEPPPVQHEAPSYSFPSHWSAEDCAKVIEATGKAEAAQLEAFSRTLHGPEKKPR